MEALNRLPQLHLVADEDEIPSCRRHPNQVCHRHLSRFIDKQVVQCPSQGWVAEHPGCGANEKYLADLGQGSSKILRIDCPRTSSKEGRFLRSPNLQADEVAGC